MFIGYVLVLVLNGQISPVSEHIYPTLFACNQDKQKLTLRRPMHEFECASVERPIKSKVSK